MMKKRINKWICLVLAFAPLCVASQVQAVSISPQMVEQFKRLPPSEQQRLARQYGIDPTSITSPNQSSQFQEPSSPVVMPRRDELLTDEEDGKAEDEVVKPELKPFGYDLFAGEPSTYAPATDVPVPSDYTLGPGDEIRVQLYGKDTALHNLIVDRNGAVAFPDLGPVQVASLSFAEARQMLVDLVAQKMIGVSANITMGELRSIRIFVAGDAYRPGSYTVSALSTVTHALSMAGGLKEIGSLRNIQVKRAGQLIGRFDAYDLLLYGDSSGDIRLLSGDVVFIPALSSTIAVDGDVRRPAIYELKGNETMDEVVSMAGGVLAGAYPAASIVERYNQNYQRSIVGVNLTNAHGKRIKARNGDHLTVRSTGDELNDVITLVGAVTRPGSYQWREGMRVSDVLSSLSADLTWNTEVDYALVVREKNLRGDISVLGFRLAGAITTPGSADDLVLQPRDRLIVFSDRDEAIDRREIVKLFNAIESEEELQSSGLTRESDLVDGLDALEIDDELSHRSSIAGVAIQEEQRTDDDEQLERRNERLKSRLLLSLFQQKSLIELSALLTREELLHPIMAKLNAQSRYNKGAQVVAIAGEVAYPGIYPLVTNGKVSDLVALAGGLQESAYLTQAELSRTQISDVRGSQIVHLPVSLGKAVAGDSLSDLSLLGRDRLQVFAKPDWQDAPTVELRGEVKFPGVYVIQRGETLADVIERAGGFTDFAYTKGGVFTRESIRQQEQLEIQRVTDQLRKELATRTLADQRDFASVDDTFAMLNQLENVKANGRLVVDFEMIVSRAPSHDLNVEAGDMIYIPPMRQTIAVMGEVQHPSSHRFDSDMSVEDYLLLAGGEATRADDKRTYVIRADGSVMLPKSSFWFGRKQSLMPGDTIIVPLDTDYKDRLTLWNQVSSLIYNSAVTLAALDII